MPEVNDPTNGSLFRSRRRRKRKIANPITAEVVNAKSCASSSSLTSKSCRRAVSTQSHKNISVEDEFEFGSKSISGNNYDRNASLASMKPDTQKKDSKRNEKHCLLSKNSVGGNTAGSFIKSSGIKQPLPRATNTRTESSSIASKKPLATVRAKQSRTTPRESLFKYAVAIDTRYIDTEEGKKDQDDFQQMIKHFVQTTFTQRGLSPSVVTSTGPFIGDDTPLTTTNRTIVNKRTTKCSSETRDDSSNHLRRESGESIGCNSSNIRISSISLNDNNLDEVLLNVRGTPIIEKKNENRSLASLPKELMANATWDVFSDLGT